MTGKKRLKISIFSFDCSPDQSQIGFMSCVGLHYSFGRPPDQPQAGSSEFESVPVKKSFCISMTAKSSFIIAFVPFRYFISAHLREELALFAKSERFDKVTLVGVCTDICVISNAFAVKTALPEADVVVLKDAESRLVENLGACGKRFQFVDYLVSDRA